MPPPPPPPKPSLHAEFEQPDPNQTFETAGSVDIRAVLLVSLADPADTFGPPDVTFEVRAFPVIDDTIPPLASGKGSEAPLGRRAFVFNIGTPGSYVVNAAVVAPNVGAPADGDLNAHAHRRFGVRRPGP